MKFFSRRTLAKINRDIWRKPYEPKIEHYGWNRWQVFKKGFWENGTLLSYAAYLLRKALKEISLIPYYFQTKRRINKILKSDMSQHQKMLELISIEIGIILKEKI